MTSGNPIFDKNLECIEKYNPQLKEKLLNMPDLINKFGITETEQKEPNLSFNGFPIHSQVNAEQEAKDIFEKIENEKLSRHIVFGIGLGYLFKEACEHSKGFVFLYEPELEILRVTLEIVDFSEELSKKNVFVFSSLSNLQYLYHKSYIQGSKAILFSLPTYRVLIYGKQYDNIVARLGTIISSKDKSIEMAKSRILKVLKMTLQNFPLLLKATPVDKIKNVYAGKTAIVVSAGPTLDANIETIKKYRDNIVIFGVGQSFKALMSNGITPDFVSVVEIADCSGHLGGYDLSNINLITDTFTNNNILKLNVKRKFLFPSMYEPLNMPMAALLDFNLSDYEVQGTVSYSALSTAKLLGCTRIALVGQDLAYLNNQCYSKDSVYSDIFLDIDPKTNKPIVKVKDEENYKKACASADPNAPKEIGDDFAAKKIKITQQRLRSIKGITGETLFTGADYAQFIEFLSGFAFLNSHLDLINTSMLGAKIDGFKNIPLEKVLENTTKIEKYDEFPEFEYDKKRISSQFAIYKQTLFETKSDFNKAKEYIKQYEKEFKLRRKTTPESIKYIKLLLSLFEKVDNNFDSDKLYHAISFVEKLDIQFMLLSADDYTVEDTENLYRLLKKYFTNVGELILAALEGLEEQEAIINKLFDMNLNQKKLSAVEKQT